MTLIARRIKAAREAAGLTQRQLSDQLGFKDRQTVAAIEAGNRKVSAQELIQIMRVLERDLDYFTDPFRLDGESSFHWRAAEGADERLAEFELRASRWLALYRTLVRERHDTAWWSSPIGLSLTARSSYEDAHRAAEWIASDWKLGPVPAATLETAIRERLQTLVLHVDAPEGVSG
ncbi:MAG TPA: helix-turn-helix transcriptional regulator, partial [Candidatus Krumholzibacteria bacterium]|nr:helix-turn-helix transcriptional regulator [Candidatus Krumholzibacteria bacterium]